MLRGLAARAAAVAPRAASVRGASGGGGARRRRAVGSAGCLAPPAAAELAARVLRAECPREKVALTREAFAAVVAAGASGGGVGVASAPVRPARPARPVLVPQKEMPGQRQSGLPLSAFLLHNLASIELNAVDLAWDTVVRFSCADVAAAAGAPEPLPPAFFETFAQIADDEARHLEWCLDRIEALGHSYGDMPAHDGLWEAAQGTVGDLGARLVVVPMIQEARGLDHGDRLAARLVGAGDKESAAIVQRISDEEVPHVKAGVVWFTWLCERTGKDPGAEFARLAALHAEGILREPFNHERREAAGLPVEWYMSAVEAIGAA